MSASAKSSEQPCCDRRSVKLSSADLPLSCPPRNVRVWDGHPRVYLPIEEVGRVVCPYCGTEYVLTDFIPPEKPLIVE